MYIQIIKVLVTGAVLRHLFVLLTVHFVFVMSFPTYLLKTVFLFNAAHSFFVFISRAVLGYLMAEQDGILLQKVKRAGWNKRAGWKFS